ncbi:DNA primase [Streptococcus thoraltensis]|uniref:DNA primase n=1 Tax=Streptococcus thoraltensis TaxID=55085 RepID=UPI00036278D8|nr:DNA primase [Streptococcus thoraltensis]
MILDKETIAQIKQETNIVDIIGEVVALSKAGHNYLGLCPFHKEKTPSFNVIEDKQFYHCFGCGKSGDVFKFLEDYRQIPFKEAASVLAERLGMSIQVPQTAYHQSKHPHEKLFQINADANKFFQAVLMTTKQGEAARQYLYDRGLTDELIKHFQIGLSPEEPDYLFKSLSNKYDEETILASGLFNLSEESNRIYDAFQNRIMFALTNDQGKVIGFSGRIWTDQAKKSHQAKYKNTRSTPIFNKSYEFYHLDQAKPVIAKKREVYLMEGFMDVIAAYQAGVVNAVASMGTALTQEHVSHLSQFTKKIVLTYDGDAAGQNAIAKSLEILSQFSVDIVKMPQGMDPDEYLQTTSAEELTNLLANSRISQVEFWIYYLLPENSDNLQSQIAYVEKIADVIAKEQSITAQNTYINKVADLLPDFDYHQVEQSVNNRRISMRQNMVQSQALEPVYIDIPIVKQVTALRKTENHLFHRMLFYPVILNDFKLRQDFQFNTPELVELYQLLLTNGEITSYELSGESEAVQQAYYQILEEQLPEEVGDNEISDLERHRDRLLAQNDMRKQSQLIKDTSNQGDQESALAALEALIAQKRSIE